MAYKEPGVYVSYNNNATNTVGADSPLIPCIMGSGAKFMKAKIQVTRSSNSQVDKLDFSAKGTGDFSIVRIGQTSTSTDYYDDAGIRGTSNYKKIQNYNDSLGEGQEAKAIALPKADYTAGVDVDGKIIITWASDSLTYTDVSGTNYSNGFEQTVVGEDTYEVRKTRKPDDDFVYFVELIYPVNSTNRPQQFQVNLVSSDSEIYETYGDILSYATSDGTQTEVNRLALGLYLAWVNAGGKSIYGLQVEYNAGLKDSPDQYDYSSALTKIQVIDSVYRIVPLDLNNNIADVIINHVETMSSPEEKMERRAFVSYLPDEPITSFAKYNELLSSFCKGINNPRICVVGKYNASILAPDGTIINPIDINGSEPFICAALAGLECSLDYQQSLTNRVLRGFNTIEDIMPLLRTQKNILASSGVILLEQTGGNNRLLTTVRHSLTTCMQTTVTREPSITTILDYVGKGIRASTKNYIGREVISDELLARVEATGNGVIDDCIQKGILIDGSIADIAQDEANPDSLSIAVSVLPPYPCNYINIVISV